jgi:hypothetical protein
MASITTRAGKGSALTHTELDDNFTNLNTELGQKLVASSNLSDVGNASTALNNLAGSGDVDFGSYKILYSNVYTAEVDLPSAASYHGMFAHVHGTGSAYYAHASNWIKLVNYDTSGNVTISGNLTVSGTTTTVNSSTLNVADINITIANGAADAAAADGAGITVDGASATMTYSSANDEWQFNKPIAGTYQELHPVVGAITTAIDMNKPFMTVTATSMAEGRVSILKFKPASYTPTWPSEINWADATEPTWADYNTWVISLVCDSGTDILASATGHTV